MVFCNNCSSALLCPSALVTILILIDGFLQSNKFAMLVQSIIGHNPYFNRWFSAIEDKKIKKYNLLDSHNPYFNRWFSAI